MYNKHRRVPAKKRVKIELAGQPDMFFNSCDRAVAFNKFILDAAGTRNTPLRRYFERLRCNDTETLTGVDQACTTREKARNDIRQHCIIRVA